MDLRRLLVGLIVVATVGFVVGVAIERAEGAHAAEAKPFGIDIEATPFIVLAALVSLGLAAAAWLRPNRTILLIVAVVILAFGVLDVREVVNKADVPDEAGIAVLAGIVAALHLAAALVAMRLRNATMT